MPPNQPSVTVILFSVSVPVLSLQMAVAPPMVSQAASTLRDRSNNEEVSSVHHEDLIKPQGTFHSLAPTHCRYKELLPIVAIDTAHYCQWTEGSVWTDSSSCPASLPLPAGPSPCMVVVAIPWRQMVLQTYRTKFWSAIIFFME